MGRGASVAEARATMEHGLKEADHAGRQSHKEKGEELTRDKTEKDKRDRTGQQRQ